MNQRLMSMLHLLPETACFGATLTARSLDLGKQQVLDVIPATWGQILYLELSCTLTGFFAPVGSHPQRHMR